MKNIGIKLSKAFKRISLVDRFLMLMMFILFIQSAYALFAHEAVSQDASTIDTIIRTSAAAIFGYFLSSNFMKLHASPAPQNTQNEAVHSPLPAETTEGGVKCQIGFTAGGASNIEVGKAAIDEPPADASVHCDKIQVIVISVIGIFSLILLLILRNFAQITPQSAATVSQLRDFISSCVGFLVSCGKRQ